MASDPKFVENLLLDILKRQDSFSDNFNEKIDRLDEKIDGAHNDLRKSLNSDIDSMGKQVKDNTEKIARHEQYFNLVAFLITGGLAIMAGWASWMEQIFGGGPKPPHN